MTTLTLELSAETYRRLHKEAIRLGKPPQVVAQEWLVERLSPLPLAAIDSDREKVRQTLRSAGLLRTLGPTLRELADPTVRLEDIKTALDRAGGQTLSQIVLEQRGSKE
jgi:hypothetical protein